MARKVFLYCRLSVRGIYKLISDYFSGGRPSHMGTWCFVICVLLAWASWWTNILVAGDLICHDAKDTSLYCESQASHDGAYTNGSKVNERVGAAAVIKRRFRNGETTCRQLSKRLPDNSDIFAAEVTAITIALNYYRRKSSISNPSRRPLHICKEDAGSSSQTWYHLQMEPLRIVCQTTTMTYIQATMVKLVCNPHGSFDVTSNQIYA